MSLPEFKGKVCVILAGYADKIEQLMTMNAGFPRRFSQTIVLPDWEVLLFLYFYYYIYHDQLLLFSVVCFRRDGSRSGLYLL